MALFVEEFLYRGKAPGVAEQPAWHVVLGDAVTDAFGNLSISLSGPLPVARAETLGFGLPSVIAEINAVVLATADALRQDVARLDDELKSVRAEAERAAGLAAAEQANLASTIEDAERLTLTRT